MSRRTTAIAGKLAGEHVVGSCVQYAGEVMQRSPNQHHSSAGSANPPPRTCTRSHLGDLQVEQNRHRPPCRPRRVRSGLHVLVDDPTRPSPTLENAASDRLIREPPARGCVTLLARGVAGPCSRTPRDLEAPPEHDTSGTSHEHRLGPADFRRSLR